MENKPKLYLVTGAAGHLGSVVTLQLIKAGQKVRALVLPNEAHVPEQADIFFGDIREQGSIKHCFENLNGSDLVVIHCAGIVSITSKFDQTLYDVNVTGTKNVVDLCVANNVSKLIYVSTVHAIPERPKGMVISETTDFDPDLVIGSYAKTKAEATAYVLAAAKKGLNATVVHPSGIIGPHDYGKGHLTMLIIDFCKRKLTSGIDGGYDFVDVRDVASGIIVATEKGKPGGCYILSNKFLKISELLLMLHNITGIRKITTILPFWFVKASAPLAEFYYKLRHQPPLFNAYSLYTLNSNALFSHQKATAELGYHPRDLMDTLTDTVDWLKENGRI